MNDKKEARVLQNSIRYVVGWFDSTIHTNKSTESKVFIVG